MFLILWKIVLCIIISSVSTVFPRTEPAFFIRFMSLFKSRAMMLACQQMERETSPCKTDLKKVLEGPKLPRGVQSALFFLLGHFTVEYLGQSCPTTVIIFLIHLHLFIQVFLTYNHLLSFTFIVRWFFPHYATIWSTSFLFSASCPSLTHRTTAESSAHFY